MIHAHVQQKQLVQIIQITGSDFCRLRAARNDSHNRNHTTRKLSPQPRSHTFTHCTHDKKTARGCDLRLFDFLILDCVSGLSNLSLWRCLLWGIRLGTAHVSFCR